MNQLQMENLHLRQQVKYLQSKLEENAPAKMQGDLIEKLILAALTGASTGSLKPQDAATYALEVADAAFKKLVVEPTKEEKEEPTEHA